MVSVSGRGCRCSGPWRVAVAFLGAADLADAARRPGAQSSLAAAITASAWRISSCTIGSSGGKVRSHARNSIHAGYGVVE